MDFGTDVSRQLQDARVDLQSARAVAELAEWGDRQPGRPCCPICHGEKPLPHLLDRPDKWSDEHVGHAPYCLMAQVNGSPTRIPTHLRGN